MKKKFLTLILLVITTFCFSQIHYKKIYKHNEYNKDWVLIKTISGTYGFIDRNGKTVVQPIYDKIEKFGKYSNECALVKNIAGAYGFIDRNGKEVIPAIYWKKQDVIEQLKILKN
ncbi:MAG: WG repeat-containing protein [Bacteroidetes bacterium]|jgi:ribosomal protein S24E|nr:WG repeat-containing protein [Bacteroidota bacterium]